MAVFRAVAEALDSVASTLMGMLKFHINDYCDLETTYGDSFVAKDGSMATILRYNGFRSLLGENDFRIFVDRLVELIAPNFSARGHQMQVVFIREDDPDDEVMRYLEPMYETAEALRLNIQDVIDEKRAVHRRVCMDEKVFFVLWTRPAVLDPIEVKIGREEAREMAKKYQLPSLQSAQNVFRPIRHLVETHESFVSKVRDGMLRLKCAVEIVPVGEAFCEVKRYLYRTTPLSWRPVLAGDPIMARWKNNRKMRDASELMPPRLDDQLFIAPGVNGNAKGIGGLTDINSVRINDRLFSPVVMKLAPNKPKPFNELFGAMNKATTMDKEGKQHSIPWSMSFNIEGDGLKAIQLRKIFGTFLGRMSADNRNLAASSRSLENYKESGHGEVVRFQSTIVTWAPYGEERLMMMRRSKLVRALEGWGNMVPELERGDGMEILAGATPALTLRSAAPDGAPPLHDVTFMLPLTRPASPFTRGTTICRSLDGKIMPYEIFSAEQNTWITLLFGGPGSGKSVTANRLNLEMALMPGLKRLPYIGVIDIGISSTGFISLIKDALPEKEKHLASYVRLQNRDDYSMNQADTQLGLRYLLPREREYLKNFLVALATPANRGTAHDYMDDFVGRVIDMTYRRLADDHDRSEPRKFAVNLDERVRDWVHGAGIEYNEATTWWNITDKLFDLGMSYEASVAQRYAVPILQDFLQAAADVNLAREFEEANIAGGQNVVTEFRTMITSAVDNFPIFRSSTRFDIGESRIMSLDLQDVVPQGSDGAKKQASIMYMVALNAIMRKISIIREDLDAPQMTTRYRRYHATRVDQLAEDKKRLFVDEYHKTGDNPNLREAFLIYGRESRKWMLEIVLASQLPGDFKELASIATSVLILDQGTESTRRTIQEIFSLSPVEVGALKTYVNGPEPGIGATFLAKIKTKNGEMSQLFTASSGGLELWGLSTTGEDRKLRSLLYDAMPGPDARAMLKTAFPTGSCKKFVDIEKAKTKQERGEAFIDDEAEDSVIESTAKRLIEEWKRKSALGEALATA
ncbi:IcmB protein [Ralstonia sp. ASV6]|uniref:IcmB protein n=1 Tax=Ralstonia sp. ASV6 TaxID=2795124 RepID=UPI0018ED5A98|nr:IcmB protein [Ralstonia sp. ASV6]